MSTQIPLDSAARSGAAHADTRGGIAALAAAGISVAVGATQLLYPQDTTAEIDPRTRVLLLGVTGLLWALVVVHLRLAVFAGSRWGARSAAAGVALLSLGTASSAVNGSDLAIFPVVATVANALWFIGAVALAVSLWRAGRIPRALAAGLVVVMPCTIFLSQLGGGVLAGAYLAVLGWLLLRGQLDRRRR